MVHFKHHVNFCVTARFFFSFFFSFRFFSPTRNWENGPKVGQKQGLFKIMLVFGLVHFTLIDCIKEQIAFSKNPV